MATVTVDLGFVNDECDSRLLDSHYFPSKIGGKPAWLSLKPIPITDHLTCPKCSNQLVFLLQIYSPRSKPEEDAFHRTLFLFVCRNSACSSLNDGSNVKVFRSQLPRANQFFSSDPPPDEPYEEVGTVAPSAAQYQSLCEACGCFGSKQCSQCKAVNYCSKDHQTRHWKAEHKKSCGKPVSTESEAIKLRGVVFPEYELEIEEEELTPDTSSKDEATALQEFQQLEEGIKSVQPEAPLGAQYSDQDLEVMAAQETEDHHVFNKFQKRVAHNKEQVLRYSLGGEPLWVSSEHQARQEDIPACSCGAPRQFEFQVMPQLLNHLDVDDKEGNSLDWGTLCVYTCQQSCAIGSDYSTEFVWKQDFTQKDDS